MILHGSNAILKVDGQEIGQVTSFELLETPSEHKGPYQLENLDPVLMDVTVTTSSIQAIKRMIKWGGKKRWGRGAKGKRVLRNRSIKGEKHRLATMKQLHENATHQVQEIPAIDCLRECPQLGACCKKLVLWVSGTPWPYSTDPIEAQRQIDEYPGGALPFELLAHGVVIDRNDEPTDKHAWYVRCKMVQPEGTCGIYEHRPHVCRIFVPGSDGLCVMHPNHQDALARFDRGIREYVAEPDEA